MGIMVGVNQPVHWFLKRKGLGIQQGTSVWVGSPKTGNNVLHIWGPMPMTSLVILSPTDYMLASPGFVLLIWGTFFYIFLQNDR